MEQVVAELMRSIGLVDAAGLVAVLGLAVTGLFGDGEGDGGDGGD